MLSIQPPALALAEGGGANIYPDGSIVVILILFILFVFVLKQILFKPIGRVLDEREARTDGAVNEARGAVRRFQAKLSDYEAAIRQARAESYRKLEQQREVALAERSRLLDEAKQQAAAQIASAKTDIAGQADVARAALETESRQIADRISRTVLGRPVGGGAA